MFICCFVFASQYDKLVKICPGLIQKVNKSLRNLYTIANLSIKYIFQTKDDEIKAKSDEELPNPLAASLERLLAYRIPNVFHQGIVAMSDLDLFHQQFRGHCPESAKMISCLGTLLEAAPRTFNIPCSIILCHNSHFTRLDVAKVNNDVRAVLFDDITHILSIQNTINELKNIISISEADNTVTLCYPRTDYSLDYLVLPFFSPSDYLLDEEYNLSVIAPATPTKSHVVTTKSEKDKNIIADKKIINNIISTNKTFTKQIYKRDINPNTPNNFEVSPTKKPRVSFSPENNTLITTNKKYSIEEMIIDHPPVLTRRLLRKPPQWEFKESSLHLDCQNYRDINGLEYYSFSIGRYYDIYYEDLRLLNVGGIEIDNLNLELVSSHLREYIATSDIILVNIGNLTLKVHKCIYEALINRPLVGTNRIVSFSEPKGTQKRNQEMVFHYCGML